MHSLQHYKSIWLLSHTGRILTLKGMNDVTYDAAGKQITPHKNNTYEMPMTPTLHTQCVLAEYISPDFGTCLSASVSS